MAKAWRVGWALKLLLVPILAFLVLLVSGIRHDLQMWLGLVVSAYGIHFAFVAPFTAGAKKYRLRFASILFGLSCLCLGFVEMGASKSIAHQQWLINIRLAGLIFLILSMALALRARRTLQQSRESH